VSRNVKEDTEDALELARKVLRTEAAAILSLVDRLGADFERALDLLFQCRGASSSPAWASRGSSAARSQRRSPSTGTSAFFLHPAEPIHGDLGAIREDDVVALSHSGETES
jgi:arabinose-5-phosphate isomerase